MQACQARQEQTCSLDCVMTDLNELWSDILELLFPPIATRKRTNSTEKLLYQSRYFYLKNSSDEHTGRSHDESVDTWEAYSLNNKSQDSYDYISGKWRRSNTRNEQDVLDAMGVKVEL
ncbi:hypothetical protein TrCOL_g13063 [Triparma columacea]|uniref:Uncharacterized protein n=1 Tax=Triparma columacea TaxID=722753 RepID=A0A9W7G1E5_9STRA|nr:hypothetical protein TrCOL_g13063 [Triparma columacea]